jgi:tripartite-type tricarboxylate transporter receptor subunit TctC
MRLARLVAAAALAAFATAAPAQSYPSKPIRLIVPFAPGGATDLIGRLIAQKLSESLKQQVLVENRAGAGSTVGTDLAAKAAPDGYTLVMAANTSMGTAPLLYEKLPYKPLEDFVHIAMIGTFPNGFVVNASHPAKTLAEFIALSKQKPQGLTYGSAGPGSAGHLTGELLKSLSGTNMLHIPYRGTGPATADLLAGQIDAMFDGMPTATQQVRAGKVRLLAVTGPERLATFPDVPTMNEVVRGVIGTAWFGISAPARTPQPIVDQLQAEVIGVLRQPDVIARLGDIGTTLNPIGSQAFAAFIASEVRKWAPVIQQSRVKVE